MHQATNHARQRSQQGQVVSLVELDDPLRESLRGLNGDVYVLRRDEVWTEDRP
jgi:hypothetical protein